MNLYTSCATCSGELLVGAVDSVTHANCRPPKPSVADGLFENFTKLVAKIAAPGYHATAQDALNLGALQDRIDSLDAAPPRLGAAAVLYAQWGWPVFPLRAVGSPCRNNGTDKCAVLCQCPKTPATKNGFKDATTDLERIKAYWTAHPTANIGIATGHAFDVIDVDLPDGPKSFEQMVAADVLPDVHGQAQTASGGAHYLIQPTGDGNSARMQPGIDYRGVGGYVVAPPSWLGDKGHQWSWVTKPSPSIKPAA